MDQIVNQAAHIRYMTGGQATAPMVIRGAHGAGRSKSAQHSQSLHAWFAHVPGLKVVLPATPYDAKGLIATAVEDPNPVIIFEDKNEYGRKGEVPEEPYSIPFGEAAIHRPGRDVTVVATSSMVWEALDAAESLAGEGIDVEVIDPRTLVPLDVATLVESASKTGRVVVVDEGHRSFGTGAELAATIGAEAFGYLEYPVARIGATDTPVPFSPVLEQATMPKADQIVDAIRRMT
jgi:pyruvate dehydrogenase E1 component beta subunit